MEYVLDLLNLATYLGMSIIMIRKVITSMLGSFNFKCEPLLELYIFDENDQVIIKN